ncbi:MAG: type II secretion system F family protein [Chloroflexota bacterium]
MSWLIILIVALLLGGAIALVVIGRRPPEEDPLEARLAEIAQGAELTSLEELEMQLPFTERVIVPLARKFGELATRFTPQQALQETAKKLEMAGSPAGLDPTLFWALRLIFAIALGGLAALLLFRGSKSLVSGTVQTIFVFLAPLIGFFLPQMWLMSKIQRRQKEIRNALPDALDLLTICVEAGLGFDAAMKKVNEKWDNELSLAFGRALQEIQLGKLRREALRDMEKRLGVPELTSFVAAVIQSEQLGVSMASVLRIQSEQMRVRRRQLAEEEAHKAPLKMLLPMAGCIFPTILIILMGPAGIILFQTFTGGLF